MNSKVKGIGCRTDVAFKKLPRMTNRGKAALAHYDIEIEELAQFWAMHRRGMPLYLKDNEGHQTELRAAMKSGAHHVVLVATTMCRKGRLRHMFHAPGEDKNL